MAECQGQTVPANTSTAVSLINVPRRFLGVLSLWMKMPTGTAAASFDVSWTGTVLTVTKQVIDQDSPVTFSGSGLSVAGGKLCVTIFSGSGSPTTITDLLVDFDGGIWVE